MVGGGIWGAPNDGGAPATAWRGFCAPPPPCFGGVTRQQTLTQQPPAPPQWGEAAQPPPGRGEGTPKHTEPPPMGVNHPPRGVGGKPPPPNWGGHHSFGPALSATKAGLAPPLPSPRFETTLGHFPPPKCCFGGTNPPFLKGGGHADPKSTSWGGAARCAPPQGKCYHWRAHWGGKGCSLGFNLGGVDPKCFIFPIKGLNLMEFCLDLSKKLRIRVVGWGREGKD